MHYNVFLIHILRVLVGFVFRNIFLIFLLSVCEHVKYVCEVIFLLTLVKCSIIRDVHEMGWGRGRLFGEDKIQVGKISHSQFLLIFYFSKIKLLKIRFKWLTFDKSF